MRRIAAAKHRGVHTGRNGALTPEQGASAALGLARALQSGADPWFRAAAVAPISGAYDFRHWAPRMPVRLRYSPGDEEAVNANTKHCHDALAAHGVSAPTIDVGVDTDYNGFVHEGSEVLGVQQVTRWFTQLSK